VSKTTIGVIGNGVLSQRMIRATFNDQLEAVAEDDDFRLVLPVTKDHFTDEVMAVADWAIKNEVPFEVVTDESADKLKIAADYIEAAVKEHRVKAVALKIVGLVEKDEGKLFIFWDEEDDDAYRAFEKADEVNVVAYDLCNGLEKLSFGDDEEEDETPLPDDEAVAAQEEGDDEPEPGGHELDERAEMGRKTVKELKALLVEAGVTLTRDGKGRIGKDPHLDALMGYRETGWKVWKADPDGKGAHPDESDDEGETDEILDDADAMAAIEEAEAEGIPDDEVPGDVVKGTGETTAARLPVGKDGQIRVIEDGEPVWKDPESTQALANPTPLLVGECKGCGGPIFAVHGGNGEPHWPDVKFFHAPQCPLDTGAS
jgi:hypothetical protein